MKKSLLNIVFLSLLLAVFPTQIRAAGPITAVSCTITFIGNLNDPTDASHSQDTVAGQCDNDASYLLHITGLNISAPLDIPIQSVGGAFSTPVFGLPTGEYTYEITLPTGEVISGSRTVDVSNPGVPPSGGGVPVEGGEPGQIRNPVISKIIGQMDNSDGGAPRIQLLLRNGIILAMGIAGIIFVFIFIRGGYVFLTSGPDKDAHQKAAKMLTQGTVGLTLMLSLFAIIYLLNTLFGINIYDLTIGSIG